jgi:hypothetical protein
VLVSVVEGALATRVDLLLTSVSLLLLDEEHFFLNYFIEWAGFL